MIVAQPSIDFKEETMQSQQQPQLSAMIKGQMIEGYLLVRAAEQRTSSNGSKYLDLTLSDRVSEVNAKMWDGQTPPPKPSTVVKVRGMMLEYNGRPQLRVDKMRPTEPADGVDLSQLVPCAPETGNEMMAQLNARIDRIQSEPLRAIVRYRIDECREQLTYYPAASKLHHAERSGLLHHITTMLRDADAISEIYPQLDGDLLAAGVMLHDLCKIREFDSDEMGLVSDYSVEGNLIGHLVAGVAELEQAGQALGTPRELLVLLEHMILSHHDLPEYGSPRRPMIPEAEVLHLVDLLDARMYEMDRALSAVNPGSFTERIWSLDRKLYRRKGDFGQESDK